jgi:hypothetical protein
MKRNILPFFAFVIAIGCFVLIPTDLCGQQPKSQPDMTIDAATRSAVIDSLLKRLNEAYVFPETAKKMEADVRDRVKKNEYDGIDSAQKFAEKLTADLQAVSNDKHLRVRYSERAIPERKPQSEPTAEQKADFDRQMKRLNYGFEKVERLSGNIGYIDLRGFMDPQGRVETVAAAMNLVNNTDALIFDLRQNGGGDPEMVKVICSYLFGDKAVHLNDLYWRPGNKTEEFWTTPAVAGKKYGNKDVYVLTSNRTFSGAEEFSYNLKNLKRATIVGETTGGGAHPGGMERLGDHFGVFVPTGRAINAITKTNWEGTGVEPDVKVPKEQALKTAYLMALNKSLANTKDEQLKSGLKGLIEQTQKELDEMKVVAKSK